MAKLKTMVILLLFVGTHGLMAYCLRDFKENAIQASSEDTNGGVVIVCSDSKSWIPSFSKRQKVFLCSQGPFAATMQTNTTIGQNDLAAASLIYQWAYSYLHEQSSDPMFQKIATAPKTDRFAIDSSLVAQNLDGFDEDRFLHHSTIDRVFNDMIRKGYHVSNELNQMAFEFPSINTTVVMAKGKHILTKMIFF